MFESLVLFLILSFNPGFCYIEALAAAEATGSSQVASPRFEPQVAVPCGAGLKGANLYPQYLAGPDRWVSDSTAEPGCIRDKMQVLELCRKSYPSRNITNIVESTKITKIDGWCKTGHKKCKNTLYVRPYRCIEGAFQSEALLVPEQCVFDHIHNASRCWSYDEWNSTASEACRSRGLRLRSFAILLPCGVDVFSGVEFVCCPKANKDGNQNTKTNVDSTNKFGDDDSEDYFDDSDESDEDDLTDDKDDDDDDTDLEEDDFDLEDESDEDDDSDEDDIMKDWTDLEGRYQEMMRKDIHGAEDFKQKMTIRFQKLVRALEDESQAEKHQLIAAHQQRVLARINVKKREAMTCYTNALNEIPASTPKVQKCLEKLLRSMHKDRHHTIGHFRHLLKTNPGQAQREKETTAEHLADIDKMTNQSLDMLNRFPSLSAKILPLMKDFLIALRAKDDTPAPLRDFTKEAESGILDSFKTEEIAKQQMITTKQLEKDRARKLASKKLRFGYKDEKPAYLSKEESAAFTKGYNKAPKQVEVKNIEIGSAEIQAAITTSDEAPLSTSSSVSTGYSKEKSSDALSPPSHPAYVPHIQERAHIAHAQLHDLGHSEPGYSIRREIYRRENRSVYVTLAFGGIALLAAAVVGIAVMRRRAARHPHHQGFIEVDQHASPEERHVANMQVNGYENPTYKYFEIKE
ncbi:hypothetical protein QYM36_015137 [Artemia franciscana]|uniref:Amyloid-beta-like protein n=1 Tax=Artemia franciscana TaxID=6661 RepID=A0AA88HHX0_ARTSF|nr:hypothetical protein QYM36_015137 [Artemia franciscana]